MSETPEYPLDGLSGGRGNQRSVEGRRPIIYITDEGDTGVRLISEPDYERAYKAGELEDGTRLRLVALLPLTEVWEIASDTRIVETEDVEDIEIEDD